MLGAFFLCLYLLTMGGHLDSPDEEVMFQVTRSLAEHGTLSVAATNGLDITPPGVVTAGVGDVYTHYGVVSSLLSVPFYEFGRGMAAFLPARYTDVVERFAVGLRNSLISAGTCVVLFAVAFDLGFGATAALALTLAFGLSTLAWPYSKHSWSEPVTAFWLLLAVYLAVRSVRDTRITWPILCSVAFGLAVGSKITAAAAAPGFMIFLFAGGTCTLRTRVTRCTVFTCALAVPALAMASLNVMRFGDPFNAGYYVETYRWNPIGVAGLLLSPSKSLFLYAPLALLGLVGIVWLARRLPWEAALLMWLFLSQLLLYGLVVTWWHGDAAWGPRYLVPIMPFVVLPLGAVLAWTSGRERRVAWVGLATLGALGILVNLGGVLVDQRVSFIYLLQTAAGGNLGRMEEQRWTPELSPVLIHWNEAFRRIGNIGNLNSQPVSIASGTYGAEGAGPVDTGAVPQPDLFPRWTSGTTIIDLRNHGQPTEFTLEYLDNRPQSIGPAVIQVFVDGSPLPEADITRAQSTVPLPDKRLPWFLHATLDDAVTGHDSAIIELRTQPWRAPRDIRDLGIQIWDLRFRSDGQILPVSDALLVPMPVTDEQPWSFAVETWFYTPPWHVADIWIWYLYLSGLPHWFMLLAVLPVVGLAWSGTQLWRIQRSLS
jgi:hypothetical protein